MVGLQHRLMLLLVVFNQLSMFRTITAGKNLSVTPRLHRHNRVATQFRKMLIDSSLLRDNFFFGGRGV